MARSAPWSWRTSSSKFFDSCHVGSLTRPPLQVAPKAARVGDQADKYAQRDHRICWLVDEEFSQHLEVITIPPLTLSSVHEHSSLSTLSLSLAGLSVGYIFCRIGTVQLSHIPTACMLHSLLYQVLLMISKYLA